MAWEQKDGQGSLFKNLKREKDTHPNAKGECMVGGVLYEIAAWTKQDKNGNPWQSLSFKIKGENASRPEKPQPQTVQELDDDIPF